MNIREAVASDISRVLAIEHDCATASHWPENTYIDMLAPDGQRLFLVAEQNGPCGFLVVRRLDREWEVENIAVALDHQRQGIGGKLVGELLRRAREQRVANIFLEVRESNLAARSLYAKCGFQDGGRRRKYYSSPEEDAVLLSCTLTE